VLKASEAGSENGNESAAFGLHNAPPGVDARITKASLSYSASQALCLTFQSISKQSRSKRF
jgi:hypothetical protein